MAVPAATFVPPTTNIVHLAGRIGFKYGFDERDVLKLLGLDLRAIKNSDEVIAEPGWGIWANYDRIYESVDVARSFAESGARDIYERARLVIVIKRKLNLHFNFRPDYETRWMDKPNPRLQGKTFRAVMTEDLRHAVQVLDFALQD